MLVVSIFRMNTCKSVSKQTTLSPFRMNTYEKPREGSSPLRLCFKSNSSNPFWEASPSSFTTLKSYLHWNQRDTNCPPRRFLGRALASSLATAASEGTNAIHPATFTHVDVLDACNASSRPARHAHRSHIPRQNGTQQNGRPPVHA